MVYQNNEMGLSKCEDIARVIEMVGEVVEVHCWISLSDRSKDFLVSMFKAYSNMELKVIYMCFECGMTGKRCEDCHYLCISDIPDLPEGYVIEISFCLRMVLRLTCFLRRYMNVNRLCGDVG